MKEFIIGLIVGMVLTILGFVVWALPTKSSEVKVLEGEGE